MDNINKYINKISKLGFNEIGTIKNLDNIPTKDGGKLGLGMECLDRDLWDWKRAFPLIKNLGLKTVRLQTGWQKTEKEEGIYDFLWLDEVVDSLLKENIKPLLSLSYGNKIYCKNPEKYPNLENGGLGHIPVGSEKERTAWQNYVTALVTHFKGRVEFYEIWNEPDVSTFCVADLPWNEAYMELVKMTCPIIREICPDAKILSCTALIVSAEILVDMDIGEWVDIHAYHNYRPWPELKGGEQKNKILHMKEKAPNLEFWRGEAGYPSYNDPKSRGALSSIEVSEIKQAKFVMRHLTCDMKNDQIEKTFYFHAYDFEHFSHTIRYHYGLIRHEDLSKKPSYNAIQVLSHLYDEARVSNKYHLSFAESTETEQNNDKLLQIDFICFEKNDNVLFAYYSPIEISNDTNVYKAFLSMPPVKSIKNPVIVDPLTRKIYNVSSLTEFPAPVTDYPMFITDAKAIGEIADIDIQNLETKEVKIEQFFEE